MPINITLDEIIIGFAAESKPPGAGTVLIRTEGFLSSEDGELLITCLESVSEQFLSRLPGYPVLHRESAIDNLLIIIRKDKTATIYLNELHIASLVQTKRDVNVGEPVFGDDIADIQRLVLENVTIPNDAGVVVVLSAGWRKGLYFDLNPLNPKMPPRAHNLEITLAKAWAYLLLQRRLKISEKEFAEFLRQQWFPFISLRDKTIQTLVECARNDWPMDDHLDQIEYDLNKRIPALIARIDGENLFEGHREVLRKALEHFTAKDYMSCTLILFPRIEGVLRAVHSSSGSGASPSQKNLSKSAVADPKQKRHELSLLLPEKFANFLESVYFASFDPKNVTDVSRNTVGHGVAPADKLTKKSAILGVLILDQITQFMGG